MSERIAVFPGSFDPFTLGHEEIVRKGLGLFDKIIIGIGTNAEKKYMFSAERRLGWVKQVFLGNEKIKVVPYEGLTVNFCRAEGANYILRGLRTSADFEFEKAIAQINNTMVPGIETIFVLTGAQLSSVSSTIIRDILRNGGDVKAFVPAVVYQSL